LKQNASHQRHNQLPRNGVSPDSTKTLAEGPSNASREKDRRHPQFHKTRSYTATGVHSLCVSLLKYNVLPHNCPGRRNRCVACDCRLMPLDEESRTYATD